MKPTPSLKDKLNQGQPLLLDGAMGTLLHQRAEVPMSTCFDRLNITQPDVVRQIHADYLAAGADLIETNTFGANRYRLGEHGYADEVARVIQAGVQLAREATAASGKAAYVLGAVGPTGLYLKPYGPLSAADALDTFKETIAAFAACAVDGLIFETFINHEELLLALRAAREVAPGLPLFALVTFNSDGLTYTGQNPARVASDLVRAGAEVIGSNCGSGPMQLSHVIQSMRLATPNARLLAMPNAGFPEAVGGRIMYPATADYFADYARTFRQMGVQLMGGCCGTTPDHIRAMRRALDDPNTARVEITVLDAEQDARRQPQHPTLLAQRLAEGLFTVTVEVAPPRSHTIDNLLQEARLLRDAGADLLDVADTPAARMKMSAWAAAHLLQTQIGIETILHFPTRGRNILRVQGDLLASHALGLRNLFVTMGDPTKIGDYPNANDASDIVPSKLIDLITHKMNAGVDMAGNSIGTPTAFTVGCALNMAADDLDNEIRVLGNKLAAGSHFALGQAVFDPPRVEAFLKRYEEINAEPFRLPVLMGVMPLYSVKHALFLHNEVPGITIPDAIFKRLEDAGDDAPQEGVRIAQELIRQLRPYVQGAYVIPSYGRYHLAAEVVDAIVSVPAGI
jgi:methionine synthase I (cobalamin-dependent)/5,10-methylenetetrahydrofolate reductase